MDEDLKRGFAIISEGSIEFVTPAWVSYAYKRGLFDYEENIKGCRDIFYLNDISLEVLKIRHGR